MKRFLWITSLLVAGFIILLALASTVERAQALPEYATQTGEPCATCHISPSGGGNRTPRGQAWVGSGKPAAVPDLIQSLELLGVHLNVDQSQFVAPADPAIPAQPLKLEPAELQNIHEWLQDYEGN